MKRAILIAMTVLAAWRCAGRPCRRTAALTVLLAGGAEENGSRSRSAPTAAPT